MDGLKWKALLKWMMWGYYHFRKHPYVKTFFGGWAVFLGVRKFRVPCCGPRGLLTGPQHCDLAVFLGKNFQKKKRHFWEEKICVFWYRLFAQVGWLVLILTHMFVERLSYSYSHITRMSLSVLFSLLWYLSGQWCWTRPLVGWLKNCKVQEEIQRVFHSLITWS